MSRTALERIQDRLFLLRLIIELDIPNPATLEKIVLILQLILLEKNRPKVFSYSFYKSRLGFSEKHLFLDLSDLHRAELITYNPPSPKKQERLRITEEGRNFLYEFSDLLDEARIQDFALALEIFQEKGLIELDAYIRTHAVILATKIGRPVLI